MFFIGTNGQPIDIVTGVIATSQELLDRIKTVAARAQVNLPNPIATTTASVNAAPGPSTESTSVGSSSGDVVCEDGVCRKVTKPTETSEPAEATNETKKLEEKVKLAKDLLEKKKKDKEDEQAKVA